MVRYRYIINLYHEVPWSVTSTILVQVGYNSTRLVEYPDNGTVHYCVHCVYTDIV